MYKENEFPFKDFLTKLILVIIFALLLVWLLPKFITPTIVQENCNGSKKSGSNPECSLAYSSLTSQIFQEYPNKPPTLCVDGLLNLSGLSDFPKVV